MTAAEQQPATGWPLPVSAGPKAQLRNRDRAGRIPRPLAFAAGTFIVVSFYATVLFSEFIAPYDYRAQSRREPLQPPATLRFRDSTGRWHAWPFVYQKRLADPVSRSYVEDTTRIYPLKLFARGHTYRLFGVITIDRHAFGIGADDGVDRPGIYLLGTDALGRDRFSRLLAATRFSLIVGPAGTLLAALFGIVIGCVAGYGGRRVDIVLMRIADAMMALPTLVLVLAARAAFPLELPPARAAVLLIAIFIALGWAEMARVARGLVLEIRSREFTLAAVSLGASPFRVLLRHILPSAAQPLLTQLLLMLPAFLLAETALSFLGVGLQEPEASWGTMLAAAADISLLQSEHAWALLTPALAITVFVLGVRLLHDGLRTDGNP
jgi:peptide/nickel transport system permease protein